MKVLIDKREKQPWIFGLTPTERVHLPTGDYTFAGLETELIIERKSLNDLVQTLTQKSARFCAELERMQAFRWRAVIIESSLDRVYAREYNSHKEPDYIVNVLTMCQMRFNCPFIWAVGPQQAVGIASAMYHTAVTLKASEL